MLNDYCFTTTQAGWIFSIGDLAGIEKGENEFEIWTKGAPGNFIEVIFKLKTSFWSGTQDFVYKFPAENSEWTNYKLAQSINGNTSLNIPSNVSLMDVIIQCSNYSSDTVKVSGMKFAKKSSPSPVELYGFTASVSHKIVTLKWQTKTEVNNFGFEVERKMSARGLEAGNWSKIGFLPGHGNSNSPKHYSFVDKNPQAEVNLFIG